MTCTNNKYIEVKTKSTHDVVRRINITNVSKEHTKRIIYITRINLNNELFYLDFIESKDPLPMLIKQQ